MNQETLEHFKDYFAQLNLKEIDKLDQIYAPNIAFTDPIHEIHGLTNLKTYFSKLNSNLVSGSFTFSDESINGNIAYLSWEMNLSLKRPRKQISVQGISVLTIEDQVVKHRDYFDAGQLFYEHIPILGGIIRMIKRQLSK